MKSPSKLTIICLLTIACTRPDNAYEKIIRQENHRVRCDSLLVFASNSDPKIRARALQALGKLQDGRCAEAMLVHMDDVDEKVRVEAAFAIGQMGNPAVEQALIEKLASEPALAVRIRIIEALGKMGSEETFLALIKVFNAEERKLREATALAVAQMATRSIINATMTKAITLLLRDKEEDVRWKAAYALMRIGSNLDMEQLRIATADKDSRVRMQSIAALGNAKDIGSLERFGTILRNDPDWRVRAKVASALGNYPLHKAANHLTLLNQTNPHVKIAIIQAIGASASGDSDSFRQTSREHNLAKSELEQILIQPEPTNNHEIDLLVEDVELQAPQWTDSEIGFALISYARLLQANAIPVILNYSHSANDRLRARAMDALGETGANQAAAPLQQNYADAPSVVKVAILNAVAKIGDVKNPKFLLNAIQEKDQVLVALAARALADHAAPKSSYSENIIAAYENLPQPVDAEPAQMIFQALGKIADKKAIPFLTKAMTLPDRALSQKAAQALELIDGVDHSADISPVTESREKFTFDDIQELYGARAFIKTNRGNIEFALLSEEAPLTVLNFVRLAERGFYDRLTFHRVVPDFVIQGGDPRGDSWGSPGYSIRSEFNKHPFIRGTVGMASAGKDTEGCQFFITHSAQPHLDGRYTVFGQVTAGMDIVDTIQEGDLMELVSIRR